jgi:phosphopantothenoylcysteine decarboxylase
MAKVLLGVTGSVAALKTPELFAELRRRGHAVRVVATRAATYFFDPAAIEPLDGKRNPAVVTLDEDEWPSHGTRLYDRGDAVLHVELRRWADLFAIVPLDANTLAKLACGLCDNCLTCVWRAWEPGRPVVLAPAMNTLMWQHPLTVRHLRQIAETVADRPVQKADDADALIEWINATASRLHIVTPISKRLACGDVGPGAMADVEEIVDAVTASSPTAQ